MVHCSYLLYVVSKSYASWRVTCTRSLTTQLEECGERIIAQIKHQGTVPKRLQPYSPPMTISTGIRDKKLWLEWWLMWLKLRGRA